MNKIGIGIITFNRPELFIESVNSIPSIDELVVVNDGMVYDDNIYPNNITKLIQHKRNSGISKSKNDALKYLMAMNCEHIFLLEDDIKISNSEIIHAYIYASEKTGIKHFNYGYHGPWNKDEFGRPKFRKDANINGSRLVFHRMLTGAFSYFRKEVIEKCGYFDEKYRNVIEHVDHTYRISLQGYHPPFYWFADVEESFEFIEELDQFLHKSTLRRNKYLFDIKVKIFNKYFKIKHGKEPGLLRDASIEELEKYITSVNY